MKRTRLLFVFSIFLSLTAAGQDDKAQNPVLFADGSFGHAWGGAGGFAGGLGLHFQTGTSLFSGRYAATTRVKGKIITPFFPIPVFEPVSDMEEYALLYGRRWIKTGKAYSLSLGVSHGTLRQQVKSPAVAYERKTSGIGLPFEANIKWFKRRKERFRLYGIIPVGRPTGFGGSLGFKLAGNLSKYSYAGLSFSVGLGYHKQYE